MKPIERLRSYALRYHNAYIVDAGFCTWECNSKATSLAKIAAKAISIGFNVEYNNKSNTLKLSY